MPRPRKPTEILGGRSYRHGSEATSANTPSATPSDARPPRSGNGLGPAGTARDVCPRDCFSHLQFGMAFLLIVAMASHLYTSDFVSRDGPVGLNRRSSARPYCPAATMRRNQPLRLEPWRFRSAMEGANRGGQGRYPSAFRSARGGGL